MNIRPRSVYFYISLFNKVDLPLDLLPLTLGFTQSCFVCKRAAIGVSQEHCKTPLCTFLYKFLQDSHYYRYKYIQITFNPYLSRLKWEVTNNNDDPLLLVEDTHTKKTSIPKCYKCKKRKATKTKQIGHGTTNTYVALCYLCCP